MDVFPDDDDEFWFNVVISTLWALVVLAGLVYAFQTDWTFD
jgi:hypothetical protein